MDRDTMKCAFKCSFAVVEGKEINESIASNVLIQHLNSSTRVSLLTHCEAHPSYHSSVFSGQEVVHISSCADAAKNHISVDTRAPV
ncbi:hypothetical protein Pcinc_008257 [Petrolisthes cinctipes]|uniref:Uncharacterized protein n=1 Tax=Petrolisthes cinctipes TaxID=88211 RepID=A0AAE1G995_PETCI|nr:hypothetical protein Pcinc_008257 [Petrolisthes cinctipes]